MRRRLCATTLALLGAAFANAAPCVTGTVQSYVNLGATGCEIGHLTFYDFKFTAIGATAGAHLFTASEVNIAPLVDVNGEGFSVVPLVPMSVVSGQNTDFELLYLVKVTDGSNIIDDIYLKVNGSQTPPGFARVVEVYCAGQTNPFVVNQICPGNPSGTANTFIRDAGQTAFAAFPLTNAVGVLKDIDANAVDGGTARIDSVINQFSLILPPPPPPPPPPGVGCPATKGFWKNAAKHPFPNSLVFPATIAGIPYSKADFYTILRTPPSGGNAVLIMGSQLIAALLNIAAGATHGSTVDAAILTAENLLLVGLPGHNPVGLTFPLNMTTAFVPSSTDLGTAMTNVGTLLDGYNGANFNTCSEGSGLTLGTP